MRTVFLSHSSQDEPFVRELSSFLQQDPSIQVSLDERGIKQGLDSDVILLILSPDSVASAGMQEEWSNAFWQQTNLARTNGRRRKLAGVFYRDCQIPPLIRNKKYFDLRSNQPEGFHAIRSWLLQAQAPAPPPAHLLPAHPPLFIGREPELAELRQRLQQPGAIVPIAEMPGTGKTTLALEFAHRHSADFESVYWLPCHRRDIVAIAADLQRQLDREIKGGVHQVLAELKYICAGKRCLLILDNVDDESPSLLIPGGLASVLVTTRRRNLRFLRFEKLLHLPLFTEQQCFDLFAKVVGITKVSRHPDEWRKLFERLGRLPLAIRIAASLIKEDFRLAAATLAGKLPADVSELLNEASAALAPDVRTLLIAVSACAPEGFRLALAASLTDLGESASVNALQQLAARSLVEELDAEKSRYRVHALVREALPGGELLAHTHAETIAKQFESPQIRRLAWEEDSGDFQLALDWSLANTAKLPAGFADQFAYNGYKLTRRHGHNLDAFGICEQMWRSARERNDKRSLEAWYGRQAAILRDWGRLQEALELVQRREAICLELGNTASLGYCYWNWGLLARQLADRQTESEKLNTALEIFSELHMRRQRDAVAADLGLS